MGRIRTIKPEFPQSETLGRVSRDARLLFVNLFTLCDDAGRTRAASRVLANLLYPYDDDARDLMDGWLAELERVGAIRRYCVEGCSYLDIPNWRKHQKIDKPSAPKYPPFVEDSRGVDEDSRTLADRSCGDRKGSEGKGRDQDATPSPVLADEQESPEDLDQLFLFNAFLPEAGGRKNASRLGAMIRKTRGGAPVCAEIARSTLEEKARKEAKGEQMTDPFAYFAGLWQPHDRTRVRV